MNIGWLPGDGVGGEVLEAAKIVLDAIKLSPLAQALNDLSLKAG